MNEFYPHSTEYLNFHQKYQTMPAFFIRNKLSPFSLDVFTILSNPAVNVVLECVKASTNNNETLYHLQRDINSNH